jgi:hypothetical protein
MRPLPPDLETRLRAAFGQPEMSDDHPLDVLSDDLNVVEARERELLVSVKSRSIARAYKGHIVGYWSDGSPIWDEPPVADYWPHLGVLNAALGVVRYRLDTSSRTDRDLLNQIEHDLTSRNP